MAVERFQPGVDLQAVIGDLAFMQTRERPAAARLAQLDAADRAAADQLLTQFDHAIDHRVLRTAVVQSRAGEKHHRAARERGMPLQLGNELLGVQRGFSPGAGSEQAIDDQQRGLVAIDLTAQQFDHLVQPLALKRVECADELDLVADQRRVEKGQGREVLEQALVRFAQ
ncbi:hypothetical protein D3C77_224210 [compost metagenome]